MSEFVYDGEVAFSTDNFPGCCGIVVVFNGEYPNDDNCEYATRLIDFEDFISAVVSGEGVVLFTDNPGGKLDELYDMLDPSGTDWEKQTFCEFHNPNSGNRVVVKALVKT